MKKTISLLVSAILLATIAPFVYGVSIGTSLEPAIVTQDFEPEVFACGHRVVRDDATEPGRISEDGDKLVERINNYAFEGEQLEWAVVVCDKNGIEKVEDVFATLGSVQGSGNSIEVNCNLKDLFGANESFPESCNVRRDEEVLDHPGYDNVCALYFCILTVETPTSMFDEYWITVEAKDLDGKSGTMAENEYWFFNPDIAVQTVGALTFNDVQPGTASYSETILVRNAVEAGSGVLLDTFITGTDFYDSSSSGAKCPVTNQLGLSSFRYFATNGAYNSRQDANVDTAGSVTRGTDVEGYLNIEYGVGFNDPSPFYRNAEILQAGPMTGPYWLANILAPGAEMALTFKLSLPEPCNGDFDTGDINLWAEAI